MKAKIIVTLYIKNVTGALYTVNYNENTLSVSVWRSIDRLRSLTFTHAIKLQLEPMDLNV